MSDHEPTARSVALDAVIRLSIEAVNDDSGWRYQADFETADVTKAVDADRDVSERTARRACKDAAALGWVEDKRQGWDAGPRAEEIAPDTGESKITVCEECTSVWQGLTSHCRECGSECIRQEHPQATD